MRDIKGKVATFFTGTVGAFLIYAFITLLYKSMRVKIVGRENYLDIVKSGDGVIGVSWHGRMLMMPFLYPGSKLNVLVSSHRDGEIIANVMKHFNFGLVRGSSRRGGSAALREMLALLKDGNDIGITPDGPKGPAGGVKPGVAELARLSGKCVIPTTYSATPCIRASSWDSLMIPLPFSKGVIYAGEPIRYVDGEDIESFRLRIESALRQANEEADRMLATSGRT